MSDGALVMGLDIGGSGIKAALVDCRRGELVSERVRLKTPQPAVPEAVIETAVAVQQRLAWEGPIGCGFPGLIKRGEVKLAPNLDPSWIGYPLIEQLKRSLVRESLVVLNDADAAGLAEVRLGAGRDRAGTVILVTLGTGIGTAVFYNGALLPDTELGHLELKGRDAELLAAESARERKGWSWKKWARNLDRYLAHLQYLLAVDLFILGGGASKKWDRFSPHLKRVNCEVVPAEMGNLAGIIGAAVFAAEELGK